MLQKQIYKFILRWFVNSFGLWLAGRLLDSVDFEEKITVILGAGLVLSLVNVLIKPLMIILSLPALLLSLGLFMLIINGLTVYVASYFYGPLDVTSFGGAVVAGLIISLVNYALSTVVEEKI
ncbi:MAG: phage holin family protein [Candidatus Saccharimonadales bacterium]|nr:phage holin family protein [Candidatus Saccharimonadales bacterium]